MAAGAMRASQREIPETVSVAGVGETTVLSMATTRSAESCVARGSNDFNDAS